jgi:hypothetical protein
VRRCRVLSLAVVFDALLATALVSQSETSVVALLPGSTRSAGLGGAGVALVGDAGAIFANPAGLATVRHVAVEGSYEPYLAGTVFSTAAIAVRLGRITWGAGAQALDYGSEPIIVPDSSTGGRRGSPTGGTFTAADLLAVSSFVYRRGLIALGVSGKYARQQIGGYAADAWAGDAGLAIAVFDIFAVGASVQNIGGDFGNGARLPRRTRVGVTLNYVDPEGTMRLLSTLEGQWTPGRPAVLIQGVEGGVVTGGVGLVGRLGYATRSPTSDASRFTVGGGIELGPLHFDYAYQGFDVLGGGTHRVGVRWTP